MSRMTRHDLVRTSRPTRTRKKVTEFARRELKRQVVAHGLLPNPAEQPPKYRWSWKWDSCGGVVEANTRGEARARIKQKLDLPKRARLPKELQIERLCNAPSTS